jgi:hypothetical protein
MPWSPGTFEAASQGLRYAAADGSFVPYSWNAGIVRDHNGGYSIYGCGWGQVAWMVAVFQGGVEYARNMLPTGSGQKEVNAVLKAAGLTRAEITLMDPHSVWEYFDSELEDAYNAKEEDPQHFIDTSKKLAEIFVQVLEQVPVAVQVSSGARRFDFPGVMKSAVTALLGSSALVPIYETA